LATPSSRPCEATVTATPRIRTRYASFEICNPSQRHGVPRMTPSTWVRLRWSAIAALRRQKERLLSRSGQSNRFRSHSVQEAAKVLRGLDLQSLSRVSHQDKPFELLRIRRACWSDSWIGRVSRGDSFSAVMVCVDVRCAFFPWIPQARGRGFEPPTNLILGRASNKT
jgi:hypothetical protein